jgi:hypothetical protein
MPNFLQTSFFAGLAALAVPVLIHLFFRLKTKRVELGTIRFLRLVLEENARRRKVMRWLLLALRMAFVALLVGLFARPFLTAAATSGDQELLVILIDQSATMQLKGEHGRLIEQAVSEARKLIESSGSKTRFEVAFFDHAVRPITATKDSDGVTGQAVLARLQAPIAAFGATNYGAVFAWARDICVKAPPGRKQLHLFTDLQRSGLDWTEVEPLPAEVQSHLRDLGNSVVNNVAVTEVRTPRLWVRPGETPTIRASVLHGGAFALEEVPIVLEVGRVEERQRSEVRGQKSEALTSAALTSEFSKLAERITKRERVKLEPGATVSLDFELPPLNEGLWQGRISVEYDDDLAFDNQRYFAISATPAYRVLVLNGGASGSAISSETYFLETALRLAAEGESFLESPFALTVLPFTEDTALPNLSEFDAVVLANVGGMKKPDAAQLASFVRSGGGLLVFTGDNVSMKSCAALSDAGLSVGTIGEPKVTVDLPWRLTKWDESHPVFQPLSDPQHGDLRRLIFAAYTLVTPSNDATVLAEFGTGDPAVVERRVGDGTVLWVTVSCGRDWSDWSRGRLFLPLVHQLLGYEVGLTQGGRVRTRLVDAEPKTAVGGQRSEVSTAELRDSEALTSAAIPGVAQFERFAEIINTSPRESDTERCGRQEFEDRFAVKFVDEDGSSATQLADLGHVEFQQDEIWHWAACALLGVLLLEGFVGNRTTA